jgi:hypothetical protein
MKKVRRTSETGSWGRRPICRVWLGVMELTGDAVPKQRQARNAHFSPQIPTAVLLKKESLRCSQQIPALWGNEQAEKGRRKMEAEQTEVGLGRIGKNYHRRFSL